MAIVFDGRVYAAKKEEEIKGKIAKLGKVPTLVSILVGDDPASKLYVNLKQKAAARVGASIKVVHLSNSVSMYRYIDIIENSNNDDSVDGIMIQLPLPAELRLKTRELINAVSPAKDVDGLREDSPYLHPTSKAVIEIIDFAKRSLATSYELPTAVTVVGASGMVGKPLVRKLREIGYEVIECHSETENLKLKTIKADILVSATGVPNLIKGEMVKSGAIVIDVGSPRGDVNFQEIEPKASFITPVPGGVGPVTITCLLENLLNACV